MSTEVEIKDMTPACAHELVRLGVAEIVDVRELWEFAFEPAIERVINVPLFSVKGFCGAISPEEAEALADALDEVPPIGCDMPSLIQLLNTHRERGAMLLCICRSGNRSKDAVKLLQSLGYRNVFNIAGGVRNWQEQGLPVKMPVEPEVLG